MGMLSANRMVSCSPPSSTACLFSTIIEFEGGINQSLVLKCLFLFFGFFAVMVLDFFFLVVKVVT